MQLKVFSVRDEKAEAFAQPFFAVSTGMAIRHFTDWCRSKETPLGLHPEDYRLYELGVWEDAMGHFVNEDTPRLISSGSEHASAGPVRSLPTA